MEEHEERLSFSPPTSRTLPPDASPDNPLTPRRAHLRNVQRRLFTEAWAPCPHSFGLHISEMRPPRIDRQSMPRIPSQQSPHCKASPEVRGLHANDVNDDVFVCAITPRSGTSRIAVGEMAQPALPKLPRWYPITFSTRNQLPTVKPSLNAPVGPGVIKCRCGC